MAWKTFNPGSYPLRLVFERRGGQTDFRFRILDSGLNGRPRAVAVKSKI
jgi:hypothetical protein